MQPVGKNAEHTKIDLIVGNKTRRDATRRDERRRREERVRSKYVHIEKKLTPLLVALSLAFQICTYRKKGQHGPPIKRRPDLGHQLRVQAHR